MTAILLLFASIKKKILAMLPNHLSQLFLRRFETFNRNAEEFLKRSVISIRLWKQPQRIRRVNARPLDTGANGHGDDRRISRLPAGGNRHALAIALVQFRQQTS